MLPSPHNRSKFISLLVFSLIFLRLILLADVPQTNNRQGHERSTFIVQSRNMAEVAAAVKSVGGKMSDAC